MMLRLLVFSSIAGLLVGCETESRGTQDPPPAPITPIAMTPAISAAAKAGVSKRLKDPFTAVFSTMLAGQRVFQGQNQIVVCGLVNSKNGFGAYGGDQPFQGIMLAPAGPFQVIAMGEDSPNAAALVAGSCRLSGLPLSQ